MTDSTRAGLLHALTELLTQASAHVTLEQACADVPPHLLNQTVPGLPYTLWQLVEHLRIAQWDIVEFSLNPGHTSPTWPEGYWPAPDTPATAADWEAALNHIRQDQARFMAYLHESAPDLLAPLPHGTGQTLLREALLIADHAAYHTGQIILLRRLLHDWD